MSILQNLSRVRCLSAFVLNIHAITIQLAVFVIYVLRDLSRISYGESPRDYGEMTLIVPLLILLALGIILEGLIPRAIALSSEFDEEVSL